MKKIASSIVVGALIGSVCLFSGCASFKSGTGLSGQSSAGYEDKSPALSNSERARVSLFNGLLPVADPFHILRSFMPGLEGQGSSDPKRLELEDFGLSGEFTR